MIDTINKRSAYKAVILHLLLVGMIYFAPPLQTELKKQPDLVTVIDLIEPVVQQPLVESEAGKKTNQAVPDSKWGERTQQVDRETITSGQQKAASARSLKSSVPLTAPAQGALAKLGINYSKPGALYQAQEEARVAENNFGQRAKEFLKGVKEGDQTLLNTKEHIFFGYFQRIRENLNHSWNLILKDKINEVYRSGRQLASSTEHITQVYVILDRAGQVTNVLMLGESGTRQLDEAAVQAFQKAGPFPHPPKGLLDADGQVRVRWEFILRT